MQQKQAAYLELMPPPNKLDHSKKKTLLIKLQKLEVLNIRKYGF
jgi:hypothetical protein